MYSEAVIEEARVLAGAGLSTAEIARRLGVHRSTIRAWLRGDVPGRSGRTRRFKLCPEDLPDAYVYLLGLYLGDGCLSRHARDVYRLRITLDRKYPGIVEECVSAIDDVRPGARVNLLYRPDNAVEVSSYWKAWNLLFPQHGPGPKHRRKIALETWQERLIDSDPDLLLRGLIHSDGCRFLNTGSGGWVCPRYAFSNRSRDIRAIFCAACERLDLRWTSAPHTIYVSRKEDVALLDEFVGPKT